MIVRDLEMEVIFLLAWIRSHQCLCWFLLLHSLAIVQYFLYGPCSIPFGSELLYTLEGFCCGGFCLALSRRLMECL